MLPSRRQFLAAALAAPFTSELRPAVAVDPIARPGPRADLKLSLAAYSFHKQLNRANPSMTLFEFIDFAAELPLDAVELTSYFWAETSDEYLEKLKAHAAKRKLAVSGVPVGNTFCLRDGEKRRAELQRVKEWVGRAARLGAATVRVFAGTPEPGDSPEEARKRVIAALEECGAAAERAGIMLALENHGGGLTATADDLLALVKPVRSKAVGVNLDTGNFRTPDPYADMARVVPYAVVCQVKTEVFPNGKRQEADLARIVRILKEGNFHGYVALEYEAAEDPKVAVPRHVKELRKLIDG